MPSKDAARIGRIAEEAARRKYGARSDHSSWHDIRYKNGRVADVKAAEHSRNGRYGRFRLWRAAHQKLKANNGGYVFAVVSEGQVLKLKRMSARDVERRLNGISWYSSGHDGKGHQAKIPWPHLVDSR
ncbi:hypothetical protein [Haloferax volcanii]|uniref:hypothetical protein n=1 Tax=Haloferax volcanii TaxID=2246 RepID=UPI000677FEE6|nr:hypothetical protein [Haloferax alexandrinus]